MFSTLAFISIFFKNISCVNSGSRKLEGIHYFYISATQPWRIINTAPLSHHFEDGPDVWQCYGGQGSPKITCYNLPVTHQHMGMCVCVSPSNVFGQMVLKNTDNILLQLESCDYQLWIFKKDAKRQMTKSICN